MNEEREVHPQEPAEGSEEDVQEPGVDRADGEEDVVEDVGAEERSLQHPQEPAEGAEEDVRAPGADRARDGQAGNRWARSGSLAGGPRVGASVPSEPRGDGT